MISRKLHSAIGRMADFVLPPSCFACGERLSTQRAAANAVCRSCRTCLAPEIPDSCDRCGARVGPHTATESGCVHCRDKPIRFDSLVCLGMYDAPMRHAILSAKWSWSSIGMETLSELLAEARVAELESLRCDMIIPVPQHWSGRLRRHFNTASLVGSVLAGRLAIPSDEHILRRRRMTRPQKRVSISQRFRNQRDSFRIRDAHVVRGKKVLIADDVLTTGATCSEAARVLKRAGAAECHVAVIARVLDTA